MYSSILALVVIAISIYIFLPSPTHRPSHVSRGTPINLPGPVLLSTMTAISLDGLTIIPLVKLLPLKFRLCLPYTSRFVRVDITSTASELVFSTLRIGEIRATTKDAIRDGIEVEVTKANLSFAGSFGTRVVVQMGRYELGDNGGRTVMGRKWQWRGSGRVAAVLKDSSLSLALRLVERPLPSPALITAALGHCPPRFELLSSAISEGHATRIEVDGFGGWGKIISLSTPYVVGTALWNWQLDFIGRYIAKEILEGGEMDEAMKKEKLFALVRDHVDLGTYGGLDDAARDSSIPSLAPSITPEPDVTSLTPPFALVGYLIGPTLLKSFLVPDSSPELYRAGGTRAKMQAFNLLTEEIKLDLSDTELQRVSFERGSIVFDSFVRRDEAGIGAMSNGGGKLSITVVGLEAVLHSRFKLHAATTKLFGWTSGLKKVGEKGTSTTVVKAQVLQLRFLLTRSPPGSATAYTLSSASLSPFTSINTSFSLSTLSFGAELLNSITSSLETQIAAVTSLVLQHFFKNVVRGRLQTAMEDGETSLREAGIDLPDSLRSQKDH